jgi:murein DD-endopeptidase MepM/ murein hydrolase activator NlpD
MYEGHYEVLSSGSYGKADITANVTYVNGEEKGRQVVATATLAQPVDEVRLRGTKERPSWFPTGVFRWPCNGVITSYFGGRYTGIPGATTYHEAIDIANGYGTAIYASDGGTVTHSGWGGGLGYRIIIDHGNGYRSIYRNAGKVLVKEGEVLGKGYILFSIGKDNTDLGYQITQDEEYIDPMTIINIDG